MNEDALLSYEEVLQLLDKEGLSNRCTMKLKFIPEKIIAYCNVRNCKCKKYFMKSGYLYSVIDSDLNCEHNHPSLKNETSDSDDSNEEINGEEKNKKQKTGPTKESLLNKMRIFTQNQKNMEFNEIYKHIVSEYGQENVNRRNAQYLFNKHFKSNWEKAWQKVRPYINELIDLGLKADLEFTENDENDVKYIYIEAPYAKDFTSSLVFPRLLMVDGTFLKPLHVKATLLILSTITADHIALPLCAAIVDKESTKSYRFLFTKSSHLFDDESKTHITIISDQHKAIKKAINTVHPLWKYSPCAFHVIQKYVKARYAFYAMIRSTNKVLYQARRRYMKKHHKNAYYKVKPYIKEITRVKGAPFRFGYTTSSVLEGINGALAESRKYEPIYLIEAFYEFCLKQWTKQITEISLGSAFKYMNRTESIINEYKKSQLQCYEKSKDIYIVTESEDGIEFTYKIRKTINKLSCSCGITEEICMPCIHLYTVLNKFGINEKMYFEKIHQRDENRKVFKEIVLDFPDIEEIKADPTLHTSIYLSNRPGRPSYSKRFVPTYQKLYKKMRKCKVCGEMGHFSSNKYACKKHPDYRSPTANEEVAQEVETILEKQNIRRRSSSVPKRKIFTRRTSNTLES